jgi:hypothetical protein
MGSPYGRPLAAPALFTTVFLIGLLHDLRRVVSQQGYPRLDIAINLERLLMAMPSDQTEDLDSRKRWLDGVVDQVTQMYASLEPDDAYVHLDTTSVNRPVGTVDSSSLGAIDGLLAALERQNVRALKTMPIMFGINEATSETHANRQWEILVAGVKSLQHLCENLLEYLLTFALQVQGIQAKVEWRFAELRASELLRDEQVRKLKLQNAALSYALGYTSQDESALAAVGKKKADVPQPRIPTAGLTGAGGGGGSMNPDTVQPEPGSNRWWGEGHSFRVEGSDVPGGTDLHRSEATPESSTRNSQSTAKQYQPSANGDAP